jgi:predicted dehydrogenase
MRFALLGDHPDGLDMARALVASGRHQLATYSGPPVGAETLRRWDLVPRRVGDLEEVLADPAIEAVIVAGSPSVRPNQLRRALQSERHVLCVYPPDTSPDTAHEAAMIQADTRRVLLPLLPEGLHPGIARLAELAQASDGPLGELRVLEMQRWAGEAVLPEAGAADAKATFPGWDSMRKVGGEIAEVFAFAALEQVTPDEPILLAGRFERGGLFQAALVPHQPEARWQLSILGSYGRADLTFPAGWPGPARLEWRDATGEPREEAWPTWNPWPALVEVFEAALVQSPRARTQGLALSWSDAVHCLELDDAARRSLTRRRASALEYPEATEETGFKGTMTLVGCAVLWTILLLVIVAQWVPWLKWVVIPVLAVFLILQLLRWIVPRRREGPTQVSSGGHEE